MERENLMEVASYLFMLGAIIAIIGFVMLAMSMPEDERSPILRRRGWKFVLAGSLCLLAGGTFCSAGFTRG